MLSFDFGIFIQLNRNIVLNNSESENNLFCILYSHHLLRGSLFWLIVLFIADSGQAIITINQFIHSINFCDFIVRNSHLLHVFASICSDFIATKCEFIDFIFSINLLKLKNKIEKPNNHFHALM